MRQKLRDGFVLVAETEAAAGIGGGLDVVGLQAVIGVDVIGMLADNRPDHVDRIDTVAPGGRLDLADQCLVGRQEVDHLLVFTLERRIGTLGSTCGSPGMPGCSALRLPGGTTVAASA